MFLSALCLADTPRGEELVQRLWMDMQARNVKKIKEYTSKEFQALILSSNKLGASPEVLNRFQELNLIKNTFITNYSLTDIKVTKGQNIIVVAYFVNGVETHNGQQINVDNYFLSVWKKYDDAWKWVAHSDMGGISGGVVPGGSDA
jgi:ketosteroid isomerase-like protein